VFTDEAWADQLTEAISLGPDNIDGDQKIDTVARLFLALRDGLGTLDTFYRNLQIPPRGKQADLADCIFPCIRSCPGVDGPIRFKYISQLGPKDKSKAVFKGETDDKTMIVIKFTNRYHEKGHQLLAQHGLAPKLLWVKVDNSDVQECGYRVMVVMEFLDGCTAEYCRALDRSTMDAVHEDVKRAIEILHNANLVFGDLRRPNIMIVDGHAKLVDFDWCGKDGVDRYPRDLNDEVEWADGVERQGLMQKSHDLQMLGSNF
jgi:serine/threonine protein kinase